MLCPCHIPYTYSRYDIDNNADDDNSNNNHNNDNNDNNDDNNNNVNREYKHFTFIY